MNSFIYLFDLFRGVEGCASGGSGECWGCGRWWGEYSRGMFWVSCVGLFILGVVVGGEGPVLIDFHSLLQFGLVAKKLKSLCSIAKQEAEELGECNRLLKALAAEQVVEQSLVAQRVQMAS